MKYYSLIIAFFLSLACLKAQNKPKQWQNTWTYTYLKAKEGQRENLKTFVIRNWFAMDAVAVKRGLFNDYKLLENSGTDPASEWDFIVAVEYYTTGTYADIQDQWQDIRKAHNTIPIDGMDFPQLGSVIRSENLTETALQNPNSCQGKRFEMVQSYLGRWHEYLVEGEKETLYGDLSIKLLPGSCALAKEFNMLTSDFTYNTLGYYDSHTERWVETYTFSNGNHSIYEWKQAGEEVYMEQRSAPDTAKTVSRNRWTKVVGDHFRIISERSIDNGLTWEMISTTAMKRVGK